MKKIKNIVVITLILSFVLGMPLSAASVAINDVGVNHWAYSAIRLIVNAGHMGVNADGEFRPNAPIDKFETSRILASVAGRTQTLANQAYTTHGAAIRARSAQYTRWNDAVNRDIAFLLERGIFTESDLGNFIVRSGDAENLRALSRQEAAVYLVRLMGRSGAARAANHAHDFADNARINAASRPYVYYLRNLGIIAGEPGNNFNPNGIVTRTTLAVLLDRTIQAMGQDVPAPPPAQQHTAAAVTSFSGSIAQVHINNRSLQLNLTGGEVRIKALASNANIYINGQRQAIDELRPGMSVVGITRNSAITELQAQTAATAPPATTPATQTPVTPAFVEYRQIMGTVYAIGQGSIGVEMRILNPQGFLVTQRENIIINNNTTFMRAGYPVALSNVVINDVIHMIVRNGIATRVELFERNRSMNATVVERRTESVLGTNYFIVEDLQGIRHELIVDDSTVMRRVGTTGRARFNDIRIGDTLDLIAEYSLIIEAYAFGSRGFADGTISEILITRAGSSVVIVDARGQARRFHVREGAFDIHTMRLNSRVSLRLDSWEIESFTVF